MGFTTGERIRCPHCNKYGWHKDQKCSYCGETLDTSAHGNSRTNDNTNQQSSKSSSRTSQQTQSKRFRTHYDNLKVSRDAPDAVIKAAYKALIQRYHPDKFEGPKEEAARISKIIQASYAVLSDPARRAEHDRWISEQERTEEFVDVSEKTESANKPNARTESAQNGEPNQSGAWRQQQKPNKEAPVNTGQQTVPSVRPSIKKAALWFFGPLFIIPILDNHIPIRSDYLWLALLFAWGYALAHLFGKWVLYGAIALVIYVFIGNNLHKSQNVYNPSEFSPASFADSDYRAGEVKQSAPAPARAAYVRPYAAPNGQPWPSVAGYVPGYPIYNASGLSTVTVDNGRNDSDVFVKLIHLAGGQAYIVRQFYIPAFGAFTLRTVTAGLYDIRYRDLNSGLLSRSEAFTLQETPSYDGVRFSNLTVTLYKVPNGNMQTYRISEEEF